MSVRKQVVFTTLSIEVSAFFKMAFIFLQTCSVCPAMSETMIFPAAGSIPICPERNINPPACFACE